MISFGDIASAARLVPGFTPLLCKPSIDDVLDVSFEAMREWILDTGGAVAFGGALRVFPPADCSGLYSVKKWNASTTWKARYGKKAPVNVLVFAEDAFGTQYYIDGEGMVGAFWSETGEQERFNLTVPEFLNSIVSDPNGTISASLYVEAIKEIGDLKISQHFAFKIELALGGKLEVANMVAMDSLRHMIALAKIAGQIA